MAKTVGESFEQTISIASKKLTQVKVSQEIDSTLAILTIEGVYQSYRVVMKETISSAGRRYAYYLLSGNRVMLGLDNHADRKALRLKYGDEFTTHLSELIPHRHDADKISVTLTSVWTGEQFLEALESLIVELGSE
jgi:hypothetical protein